MDSYITTKEMMSFYAFITTTSIGLLGYFVKRWIDSVDSKLIEFGKNQNDCRLQLPEKYMLKHDCEKLSGKIEHEILVLQGKSNGKGLSARHFTE